MPENLVLQDGFGSPVPRQPAHVYTQAESAVLFLNPPYTPSGQSRVYWVTQLRTVSVNCRESAGIEPVNLKVVPDECCLGRSPACCCCCCCLHIKSRSGLYSVLSNIRTGPTDADAFRGHRQTTQKGYTHQKEIKGPRKVNTHAMIGK